MQSKPQYIPCKTCHPKLKKLFSDVPEPTDEPRHHCVSRYCQNMLDNHLANALAAVPDNTTAVIFSGDEETIEKLAHAYKIGSGMVYREIIVLILPLDQGAQAKDTFRYAVDKETPFQIARSKCFKNNITTSITYNMIPLTFVPVDLFGTFLAVTRSVAAAGAKTVSPIKTFLSVNAIISENPSRVIEMMGLALVHNSILGFDLDMKFHHICPAPPELGGMEVKTSFFSRENALFDSKMVPKSISHWNDALGYGLEATKEGSVKHSHGCDSGHVNDYYENKEFWDRWANRLFVVGDNPRHGVLHRTSVASAGIMQYSIFTFQTSGVVQNEIMKPKLEGFLWVPAMDKHGNCRRVLVDYPLFAKTLASLPADADVKSVMSSTQSQIQMTTYLNTIEKAVKTVINNHTGSAFPDLVMALQTALLVNNDIINGGKSSLSRWSQRCWNYFNDDLSATDSSMLFTATHSLPFLGLNGKSEKYAFRSSLHALVNGTAGCLSKALSEVCDEPIMHGINIGVHKARDAVSLTTIWNENFPEYEMSTMSLEDYHAALNPHFKGLRAHIKSPFVAVQFPTTVHIAMVASHHDFLCSIPTAVLQFFNSSYKKYTRTNVDFFLGELAQACKPLTIVAENNIETYGINTYVEPLRFFDKCKAKNGLGEINMLELCIQNHGQFLYPGSGDEGSDRTHQFLQAFRSSGRFIPKITLVDVDNTLRREKLVAEMRADGFDVDYFCDPDFYFSPASHVRRVIDLKVKAGIAPIPYPYSDWIKPYLRKPQTSCLDTIIDVKVTLVSNKIVKKVPVSTHFTDRKAIFYFDAGNRHSIRFVFDIVREERVQPRIFMYDDVLVNSVEPTALNNFCAAYSNKLVLSACGETLCVTPHVRAGRYQNVIGMVYASSNEYRTFGGDNDIKSEFAEFCDISRIGIPHSISVLAGVRTYKFSVGSMLEAYSNINMNQQRVGHHTPFAHILSANMLTTDPVVKNILAELTHVRVANKTSATKLGSKFRVPKDFEKKYWSHVKRPNRNAQDTSILNDAAINREIFKLYRKNHDGGFVHRFGEHDAIYRAFHNDELTIMTAIAGAGKTRALKEIAHKTAFVSCFKKVVKQSAAKYHFKIAETFERAVASFESEKFKDSLVGLEYIALDEAQSFGPLLYYFVEKAMALGLHIIIMGDPYQIHWTCRDTKIDEKLQRKVDYLCKPSIIFGFEHEYSYTSYRYGPQMASMLSEILGTPVVGLNMTHRVNFVRQCESLRAVLTSGACPVRCAEGVSYITLTQMAATEVASYCIGYAGDPRGFIYTAAESGGANFEETHVFLLKDGTGVDLPHFQEFNDVRYSAHAYVAITRAEGAITIYLPTIRAVDEKEQDALNGKFDSVRINMPLRPYEHTPVVNVVDPLVGYVISGTLISPVKDSYQLRASADADKNFLPYRSIKVKSTGPITRIQSGDEVANIREPISLLCTNGVVSPTVQMAVPNANPVVASVLNPKTGKPVYFNSISSCYSSNFTTGSFKAVHRIPLAGVIKAAFKVNPNVSGVVYSGFNPGEYNKLLSQLFHNYIGPMLTLKMNKDVEKIFSGFSKITKIFTLNPEGNSGIIQLDSFIEQLFCALSRYGLENYDKILARKTFKQRIIALQREEYLIDEAARLLSEKFNKLPLADVTDILHKHGFEFAADQYNKGVLHRLPTLEELLLPSNRTKHSAKKQIKHPDTMDDLYKFKSGQPVQVGDSTHMHVHAASFRLITELLSLAFGDDIQFMGPNMTPDKFADKMRKKFNYALAHGMDVAQCDSSHYRRFRHFVSNLLKRIYPFLPDSVIAFALDYLASNMDEWFIVNRSGSIKGSVQGQLASGSAWTFLWNCLWTTFNITVLIIDTEKDYEKIIRGMVIGAAGDDAMFSFEDFKMQTKHYVTPFYVTLKVSFEPKAVNFCHHIFTKNGAYFNPVRMLAKMASKPLDPTEKCMAELKNAINALACKYRDFDRISQLYEAYETHSPELAPLLGPSLDLLFRLCNTKDHQLLDLLVESEIRFLHRARFM